MSDREHAPLDHDRLLAEIDEEVRRRRESGEIPADLERELDLVFARFAPVTALDADFEQVLTRAEQSTFIDTVAPVESSRPVVPVFKKVVRKVVGWYLRYVAQQTTAFAHAITRAVRLLGERVDALEAAAPGAAAAITPRVSEVVDEWAEFVVDRMKGAPGRVVHAEAGDGVLLAALVEAGIDAYGVDPYDRPGSARFEIREDTAAVHLRALPDGAVGGVVLSGCVERLSVGALVQLADLAVAKVAPGGTVVVVSADPTAWERALGSEVDFAPGRPLHAASWRRLLSERGMEDVGIVNGRRPPGLKPVPRANAALSENLELLNDVLFGPSSYAVVARKP